MPGAAMQRAAPARISALRPRLPARHAATTGAGARPTMQQTLSSGSSGVASETIATVGVQERETFPAASTSPSSVQETGTLGITVVLGLALIGAYAAYTVQEKSLGRAHPPQSSAWPQQRARGAGSCAGARASSTAARVP